MARIRLIGVLLVIVCAGLIVFYKNFAPSSVPEAMMNQSNIIVLNRSADKNAIHPAEADTQHPALAVITEDVTPLSLEPVKLSAESSLLEKKVIRASVPVLKPRVKISGKIGLSEISTQPVRETDIRIAKILTCQGIKNKGAVSPQNIFSLQKGAKPYVWMDVRSKKTPYKLRHVYYLNGRRYCAVPLAIHYPRMRTWSNVTLRNQYEAGNWRVDVVTKKGEIVSQVEFAVIP